MMEKKKLLMEFGLRALMEQIPVPTLRPDVIPSHKNLNPTPIEQDLGPLGSPEIGKVVDGKFRTGRWDVRSQPYPSRSEKGTLGPEYDGSQYYGPEEMPVPARLPHPGDYADTSLTYKDLYGPAEKGQEQPFFPHTKLPDSYPLANDYEGPIPKPRPLPEEDIPNIPKQRPLVPASSTGGITPVEISYGTKMTRGPQSAVAIGPDGKPMSPLERYGIPIPKTRPTAPEYKQLGNAKSGIRSAIQGILGR